MNKSIKLICSIFTSILCLSCVDNKSPHSIVSQSALTDRSTTDTLKFTSGIRAIFQDSKGNYWFGSLQEGVAVYDGESFRYFTANNGLSDNQLHSIQEDKEGVIWFNTQTGVSSYNNSGIENRTKGNDEHSQLIFSIPNGDNHTSKWMKSDKDLWFEAGNKSGVYRYDGKRLHYLDLPPQKILNPSDNLFAVTDIADGKNNTVWFGTYAGVFGYNGRDFTIINDDTLGYDRRTAPLHIRSIFEDSKGRLWIGNNGIGVLFKEGDSVINFSNRHHLTSPGSKRNGEKSPPSTLEHVFVITEDSYGNIWFGDRDAGIWKYDGSQLKNYTQKDGLKNDFALSIYEDRNRGLWFGMADGTLYRYIDDTFEKQF